jgi:hypothetical protein
LPIAFELLGERITIGGGRVTETSVVKREFESFLTKPRMTGQAISSLRIRVVDSSDFAAAGKARRRYHRARFFGTVTVMYDFERGYALVRRSHDPAETAEVLYLLMHSYFGERLDMRGIHRLHAAAVCIDGSMWALTGASGVGKTTLLWAMLRDPNLAWAAEDVMLLDSQATVLPFPLRFAFKAAVPPEVEAEAEPFRRAAFGTKRVVKAAAKAAQLAPTTELGGIVVLRRGQTDTLVLAPAPRALAAAALFRWLVAGHEIPQIWQLFLRLDWRSCLSKLMIAASRCFLAGRILTQHPVFSCTLPDAPGPQAQAAVARDLTRRLSSLSRGEQRRALEPRGASPPPPRAHQCASKLRPHANRAPGDSE